MGSDVAGFTPGPWHSETSHSAHPKYGIFTERNAIVARTWREEEARLIAAAPELYEALSALRKWTRDGACADETLSIVSNADRALAKARGES